MGCQWWVASLYNKKFPDLFNQSFFCFKFLLTHQQWVGMGLNWPNYFSSTRPNDRLREVTLYRFCRGIFPRVEKASLIASIFLFEIILGAIKCTPRPWYNGGECYSKLYGISSNHQLCVYSTNVFIPLNCVNDVLREMFFLIHILLFISWGDSRSGCDACTKAWSVVVGLNNNLSFSSLFPWFFQTLFPIRLKPWWSVGLWRTIPPSSISGRMTGSWLTGWSVNLTRTRDRYLRLVLRDS